MSEPLRIWTIGHSNHALDVFLALLSRVNVEVVADVRSAPYSRYSPQFNRDPLRSTLIDKRFKYVFLGDELGGRPSDRSMYDAEGHVLYNKVAESEEFAIGLKRLLDGARNFNAAIMCSEENPTDCHRHLLVGRVLCDQGVDVIHVRGDGSLVNEKEIARGTQNPVQLSLVDEESAWRSTRSVLPSALQRASSNH